MINILLQIYYQMFFKYHDYFFYLLSPELKSIIYHLSYCYLMIFLINRKFIRNIMIKNYNQIKNIKYLV